MYFHDEDCHFFFKYKIFILYISIIIVQVIHIFKTLIIF
jgi:hypothetical protein